MEDTERCVVQNSVSGDCLDDVSAVWDFEDLVFVIRLVC